MAFWKKEVEEELEEVDFYEILKRDRAAKRAAELQAIEDAKSPEVKAAEEAQREEERRLAEERLMAERARKLVEKAKRAEAEKLAEQQRIEEEKRKEEEERLAEEVRRIEEERMREEAARKSEEERNIEEARLREEAARRAEEERIAEEEKIHQEAMRRAEEARVAEEAKMAEAVKAAEEARLAEEAKIREELARLREEAARKAEEERLAQEAARKAEEERLAQEAARKAEEERLAQEAARKAEEERLAQEASKKSEKKKLEKEPVCIFEISDQDMNDPHFYLGKQDKTYALGWHIENGEVDAFFYSRSNEIRAVEFMEFLVMDYGKSSGNSTYAQAKLPELLFKVLSREVNKTSVEAFLNVKVQEYYTDCQWLNTEGMVNDEYLSQMTKYKKKYIPWAYIKTTDIIPRGEKFRMKMLENESEVEIIADDSVYIMIGIKGEIYNISAEKFEATYKQTFELFDICNIMPMYLPTVYSCVTNKRISLGDKAHLCYPRSGNSIYAKQLENKAKVFTKYNCGEYFVGKPGDYLVVREDDFEDVYIVQKEIFGESYEKAID